jgi:hypothetical protein
MNVEENVLSALEYGEKTVKRKLNISHGVWGAVFSITLLIAIMTVSIVNVAISSTFTWSLIPISACVFTWLLFFPIIKRGSKGIFGSLVAFSFLILPFMYVLDVVIDHISGHNALVFPFSIRIAPLTILYFWVAFMLFRKFRTRKLFAAAITMLLAGPVCFILNFMISAMLGQPYPDAWTFINALSVVSAAIILFIIDFILRKRND